MTNKERAFNIYNHHIALATQDGRLFRKTVMEQLMAETGCSLAAAATFYNNAKKAAPVAGLGRAPTPAGLRKPGAKGGKTLDTVPEDECFTVLELLKTDSGFSVGRLQSFILQGDASEYFDSKVTMWPKSNWAMISGMGPNGGDTYKLEPGEKEIKRYEYKKAEVDATV